MNKTYSLWVICENCEQRQQVEIPVGHHWVNARIFNSNYLYGGRSASGYKKGYPGEDGAFQEVVCEKCGLALLRKTYDQDIEVTTDDTTQTTTYHHLDDLLKSDMDADYVEEFLRVLDDLKLSQKEESRIIEAARKFAEMYHLARVAETD